METYIKDFISKIKLGKIMVYKNFGVVPLFYPDNGTPQYLTLKEAMEQKVLIVTEISQGGSVPELRVLNKGDIPVILLDGEELAGAKQNRVLNTTILVDKHTEIVIPVSCTEHGRWSYTSREFMDSDVMMAYKIKREKMRTVNINLENYNQYRSDQGDVWDNIAEMERDLGVKSRTGAMKDTFESRMDDLNAYIKDIKPLPDQKGIMVFINGDVIGLDIVSSPKACAIIHPKLLRSYAMEVLISRHKKTGTPTIEKAKQFLAEAAETQVKVYKSIGLGWDYRFESQDKVGSALAHDEHIVHMAFFAVPAEEREGRMSGFRQRRTYRR